jgi:hypothetical protein
MTGIDQFLDERTVIQAEIERLKFQHRQLDGDILAAEQSASPDHLLLQRYKKHKLVIKDRLSYLEDKLTPDIIA